MPSFRGWQLIISGWMPKLAKPFATEAPWHEQCELYNTNSRYQLTSTKVTAKLLLYSHVYSSENA